MTAEEDLSREPPTCRVVILRPGAALRSPAIGRRDIAGVVRAANLPEGIDHIQMEEMESKRRRRPGYGKDKCGLAGRETAWARNLGRRDRCGRRGEDGGFEGSSPTVSCFCFPIVRAVLTS